MSADHKAPVTIRPVTIDDLDVLIGIGRALIASLEAWARDHGVERVILNVAEANVDAIRLYHTLGYRDYDRAMRKAILAP